MAASLVEQLVYEGPQMVARDELLMNLKNTTVHSVSHCIYIVMPYVYDNDKYSTVRVVIFEGLKFRVILNML